jgi:oligoendopeptidase F
MYSNIYNGKPIFVDISETSDGKMQGKIIHNSANTEPDIGMDSTSRSQAHLAGMTETKMLTEEEIRAFAKNPNRDIRRRAAESMNSVYLVHQNQITLGNLYTGIVKNWSSSMELRGYKTVMSKRNISEQLPDEVVDTLMSEVQKFYPLYQRFLRAKQKHLQKNAPLTRGVGSENENGGLGEDENYEKFYGYDVHAPIFKIEKKIPYEEACKTVIEMFEGFDSRFGNYARDMLASGRVDAFPKAGKRGGAFASYDKGLESFVLLNYTDTVDDSFTLAHELGHAIHGHLAQVQKSPVYDAPLVLAETASIFSESLLMEKIQVTLSPEEKLELLNQKLLDVFGSIHRQIMYVSFERRVHEHIHGGGELTYKELNLWWDEESKKLSWDVITPILPPEKNYTWSAIPHIFSTPFYCYAYSFGMLVSLALVEKYKSEGKTMIEDYVRLLSSGGSVPPVEILQSIGIDVTKPEFYSDAFATIEGWLREFEIVS